jgi:hypothetical protein
MLNSGNKSVDWSVDMANIDTVISSETDNSVNIVFKEQSKIKFINCKNVVIECNNRSQKEDISRLLLEMIQLR